MPLFFLFAVSLAIAVMSCDRADVRVVAALNAYDELLRQIEAKLAAGAVDLRMLAPASETRRRLVAKIDADRRDGFDARFSVGALRDCLAAATGHWRARVKLWRLFALRLTIGLGLAALCRLALGGTLEAENAVTDRGALGFAWLLSMTTVVAVRRWLPGHWAWTQASLSAEGESWFSSLATARPSSNLAVAAELAALGREEIRIGVSMLGERRGKLTRYAAARTAASAARLTALEEALPLIELIGIGGPAVLILTAPLLASF
jgi:hypothetical protein